jgi:hypothetical protein
MNARLCHDAAFAMATALLEIVQNCIRPEEHKDAFNEFYRVALSGIEAYCIQAERMQQRLYPSRN